MQCEKQKSVTISAVSRLFSEIDAGTKKGQSGLDYVHKIMMEVVFYFKEKTQSNSLSSPNR